VADGKFAGGRAGAIDVAVVFAEEIAEDNVMLLSSALLTVLFVCARLFEDLGDLTGTDGTEVVTLPGAGWLLDGMEGNLLGEELFEGRGVMLKPLNCPKKLLQRLAVLPSVLTEDEGLKVGFRSLLPSCLGRRDI
jgi:hypothetical protein